ncbi:hypothetical protein BHE74_00033488 [Ensete ventricosum]|nr:hypothetical protein BHE74_00033488 [Ensete ventricosum]
MRTTWYRYRENSVHRYGSSTYFGLAYEQRRQVYIRPSATAVRSSCMRSLNSEQNFGISLASRCSGLLVTGTYRVSEKPEKTDNKKEETSQYRSRIVLYQAIQDLYRVYHPVYPGLLVCIPVSYWTGTY